MKKVSQLISMKTQLIMAAVLTSLLLGSSASTAYPTITREHSSKIQSIQPTWAAALGGQAYDIHISDQGNPVLTPVNTHLPVLQYAGTSADGRYRAYTALDALDSGAPLGRRVLTVEEMARRPEIRVVPSGDLYIEDLARQEVRQVDTQGQYVITAAWSPVDANQLAYTFSHMVSPDESDFGVAVANVANRVARVLRAVGVLADYVGWSSSGGEIQFYEMSPDSITVDPEGHEVPVFASVRIPINQKLNKISQDDWSFQLPVAMKAAENGEQAFEVYLKDRMVQGRNLFGVSELRLIDSAGGVLQRVEAHNLVAVLPTGIVYKTFTEDGVELNFLAADGDVTTLAYAAAAVTYKLPFQNNGSSTVMTVTQVGDGYSTKCNVWNHTGSLAYAYDMQARSGYEAILAAGDGTVCYIHKTVTCNSLDSGSDGTRCTDYSPTCSSNGGWGNVVILAHADGSWTKYAHLRYGSVIPSTTGRSAGIGCHLATEGHTGNTKGNKNGCGDHLHFQRQSSCSRDGSSRYISFSDVSNPLSCRSYASGNAGRSCPF
jgi:hypothetical protein